MKINMFEYTDKGSRSQNEDYYVVSEKGDRYIAVLCDGMGGRSGGDVASRAAAEKIVEKINEHESVNKSDLESLLNDVNDYIIELASKDPSKAQMGTTAVGCIINKNMIQYFNVGDSRFYFFKNGEWSIVSDDQTMAGVFVKNGKMSFDQIRGSDERNYLYRSIGVKNNDRDFADVSEPIPINGQDAFLICSDGFWEYVLEEEMVADLAKSKTPKEWVEYMLVRLLLKVQPGNDNLTVIAGFVEDESGTNTEKNQIASYKEWETNSEELTTNQTFPPTGLGTTDDLTDDFTGVNANNRQSDLLQGMNTLEPTDAAPMNLGSADLPNTRPLNASLQNPGKTYSPEGNIFYKQKRSPLNRIFEIIRSNKIIIACVAMAIFISLCLATIINVIDSSKNNKAPIAVQTTENAENYAVTGDELDAVQIDEQDAEEPEMNNGTYVGTDPSVYVDDDSENENEIAPEEEPVSDEGTDAEYNEQEAEPINEAIRWRQRLDKKKELGSYSHFMGSNVFKHRSGE